MVQVVSRQISSLLIHEVVVAILAVSNRERLLQRDGMEPRTRDHLTAVEQELGIEELLGLGIWIDGVPYNWDRSQSLEVITLSFPGLTGEWKNLRIPLTAIPKGWVATNETFDDLLEIVAWSLRHLAAGVHPTARHDGEPWLPSEKHRAPRGGTPMGVQGVLAEVRGDWLMYKEVFHLPGWKETSGCCWLCTATPADIRDASSAARWRRERLSHWDLLERILRKGHVLSPLLSAPGIKHTCFKVDWLHAVDQGAGSDFLGNLFFLLVGKMEGRRKKDRIKALLHVIKKWYTDNGVESRLQTLTWGMIKNNKAPPKLRCKAAEARALIPFAQFAAERYLNDLIPEELAAKQMSVHLNALYRTLSSATIFREDLMREHCRKFFLLYAGLEATHGAGSSKKWKVKPKFHLVQELCEMTTGCCPSLSWTYRDEDFGGSAAAMAKRKGGISTPKSNSRMLLDKFVAKNQVPAIL